MKAALHVCMNSLGNGVAQSADVCFDESGDSGLLALCMKC
jgi:hypothetical protein